MQLSLAFEFDAFISLKNNNKEEKMTCWINCHIIEKCHILINLIFQQIYY